MNPDQTPDQHEPIVTIDGSVAQATQPADPPAATGDEPVRWEAHEHIQQHRSIRWYAAFVIVGAALLALSIFLMRSWTFSVLIIVVMAALFVLYGYQSPRVLQYVLSRKGLFVNDQLYAFSEFRGFGVVKDTDQYSIMLLPTKRFRPAVVVYFPEEAGERIVDVLAARLPMQEMQLDLFDRIARKLRL